MKKKILFILPTFEIGGTVVSTKNLILLLDKDKYDITVLSMTGFGEMKVMYDNIKQVSTTFVLSSLAFGSWKDEKNIIKRLICGFIRKISKHSKVRKIFLTSQAKRLNKSDYDIIVACQEGFCTEFVSYFKAKKKVAWVRCDYSKYVKRENKSSIENIYSVYDKIVCVSELTSQRFKEKFPQYSSKTYAINNPQSEEYILEQSLVNDNDLRFTQHGHTIVSVGRYDSIKRFTEIPRIASFLRSKNIEFKWYIIGDGYAEERKKIIECIAKENVEECVICLGIKTNPHYYIKNSDLLVCLSSSEACPRVINEAKILNTPTISTNFDTIYEYLEDGKNGIISPIETIQNSIAEFLQDKELYSKIKTRISDFHFDNEMLIKNIEEVLQ